MFWWICVGLVAGWATGKILKGSGYGALADIVVGILGALVGGFVMRLAGFPGSGGFFYTVFVAIIGAMILVWLEHFFSDHRGHQL
ncbi:MAG: GlsB/YeaQ/YmgE family stress response membrane protein [Gemmatimonadota bacterium]